MLLTLFACAPVVPDTHSQKGWVQVTDTEPANTGTTDSGDSTGERPVALIVAPTQAGVGETIVFDGSSSYDPYGDELVSYTWNCSDGSTGSYSLFSGHLDSAGSLTCSLEVLATSGKTGTATATVKVSGRAMADWTVMVFMNGDNDLEQYALLDFNELESVGSSSAVNLVVQLDRAQGYSKQDGDWTGARRYRVDADANPHSIASTILEDLGEVDSGAPDTVTEFVQWAHQNFPAHHYALVFWDHGDGWWMREKMPKKGISWDEGSRRQLSVAGGDVESILSEAVSTLGQPLDLVGIDACTMATWEVMDTLAPYANTFVGSQDFESALGWSYDKAFGQLVENPSMDSIGLADAIGQTFYASGDSTQSVIRLGEMAGLTANLDHLASALLASPDGSRNWTDATSKALSFDRQNRDLGTLLTSLSESSDPTISAEAADALASYQMVVHSNYTRNKFASGLAIFTADKQVPKLYLRGSWARTQWDEMLLSFSSQP